jgi:hypothetical protein
MSAGALRSILVCVPVTNVQQSSLVDQQVCQPSGRTYFHLQQQQAYVLSPESAGYIDGVTQPFDYVQAAGFWGIAFTTVLTLWLVARSAGTVISILRRGF